MEMKTVHTLRAAETVEMLSARYRIPVCMIMRANGIKTMGDFERCRRINIPRICYCNRCLGSDDAEWKVITAAAGDTLFSLARQHGVTMRILMKVNGIENPGGIREGDSIKIPVITGIIYSVREGETIQDIARRCGIPAAHIRERNHLMPDEPVFAGMQLVL